MTNNNSPADEAYQAALAAIRQAHDSDAKYIEFVGGCYTELDRIPDEVETLTKLDRITFYNTAISDLTPVQKLPTLKGIRISRSPVTDLRPIAALDQIGEGGYALYFRDLPALERDSRLAELAAIKNATDRTRQIMDYLRSLPSTPEPYTPDIPGDEQSDGISARLAELEVRMDKAADFFQASENIEKLESLSKDADRITALELQIHVVAGRAKDRSDEVIELEKRLKDADATFTEEITTLKAKFEDEIRALKTKFAKNLDLSKPRKLWEDKQEEHAGEYRKARNLFYAGLIILTFFSIGVFYVIISSPRIIDVDTMLAPVGCNSAIPETCKGFSLRAWLITATLLLVVTMMLWFIRLHMRLMLSERQLRLDARERSAYADTYIGFLGDTNASKGDPQERAVVYGAMFRRANDGSQRDDSGLELSITAMMSKFLSRTN